MSFRMSLNSTTVPQICYMCNSIVNLPNYLLQRATLAEKEVTTLKEQLATGTPTPLQANVPPKTPNGNAHLEATLRDQATETRISEHRFNNLRISETDITRISEKDDLEKSDLKREGSPDTIRSNVDEVDQIDVKMELAATVRSNSNSSRSSPVAGNQGTNLENELAAKEKEVSESYNTILRAACEAPRRYK